MFLHELKGKKVTHPEHWGTYLKQDSDKRWSDYDKEGKRLQTNAEIFVASYATCNEWLEYLPPFELKPEEFGYKDFRIAKNGESIRVRLCGFRGGDTLAGFWLEIIEGIEIGWRPGNFDIEEILGYWG